MYKTHAGFVSKGMYVYKDYTQGRMTSTHCSH